MEDCKEKEISKYLEKALKSLRENFIHQNEIQKTAKRIARVWIEMSKGVNQKPPELKWFKSNLKGFLIKGPLISYFLCPHHLLPVDSHIIIGIVPNGYVLGLSKIGRIVNWACNRFDLQENITKLIADTLWNVSKVYRPKGVIVGIIAEHSCEKVRGVRQKSPTQTIDIRGEIKDKELLLFNDSLDKLKKNYLQL